MGLSCIGRQYLVKHNQGATALLLLFFIIYLILHFFKSIYHMKTNLLWLCLIAFTFTITTQAQDYPSSPPEVSPMPMKPEMTEIWEPEVVVVTPAEKLGDAPSDAIILFDGSNLDQWVSKKDSTKPATWKIVDNDHMEVVPGSGYIQTKMKFGDCQLHIEFSAPDEVQSVGQGRGNSGVFFQDRY